MVCHLLDRYVWVGVCSGERQLVLLLPRHTQAVTVPYAPYSWACDDGISSIMCGTAGLANTLRPFVQRACIATGDIVTRLMLDSRVVDLRML